MKVLVCGSRHYDDYKQLSDVLSSIGITEVIHGDARGADRLSGDWAEANKIPVRKWPANWELYGKRAGPIRNQQMLDEGKPEVVVAFLSADSRETAHMVKISQKAGIPVHIVNIPTLHRSQIGPQWA